MVCAKSRHKVKSSQGRSHPGLTDCPHPEAGPNLHCDGRMLQKHRCQPVMGDRKTVKELAVSPETQQVLASETYNTAVWSPWGPCGPCEMRSKRWLASPSPLSLVQTRPGVLPRQEKVCIWKKKRDASEVEQNNGVSREDIDIVHMLSKNIQFPQRHWQWDHTLRTAAPWHVNSNQTIIQLNVYRKKSEENIFLIVVVQQRMVRFPHLA